MRILGLLALVVASAAAYAAAPFYQSFHNVPLDTVRKNINYYPSQGYGLRTLSIYRTGFLKPTYGAGSFDKKGISAANHVTFVQPASSFGDSFREKDRSGFRPREISGYLGDENVDGAPGRINFTTIWEPKDGNPSATYVGMSEEGLAARYQEYVVQNGYRPQDHFSYYEYGQIRHAMIFVKDGAGFYFYRGMTASQFEARLREMSAKGFAPVNLNVLEVPNGFYYSAIWKRASGAHVIYYGLTGAGYQQKWAELNAKGYHLVKIQGYNKGTQFAAIWEK
jgi:hypothetical protein